MKITGDFHTHTKASDGKGTVRENLAQAQALGLSHFAVADHGLSTILYKQTRAKLKAQSYEMVNLQKHTKVKLYRSLEANLMGFDGKLDVDDDIIKDLDILHFAFHRFIESRKNGEFCEFAIKNGFGTIKRREQNREKNTAAYIKAMENYPVDVVCHLLHRAMVDVKKVCQAAKSNHCYIELNEKHIATIENDIDTMLGTGVNFILGSDAHKPENVGKFDKVKKFITRHKIPHDRVVGLEREPVFRKK